MAGGGHGGRVIRRLLAAAVLLAACAGLSLAAQWLGWSSSATGVWLPAIVGTIALVAIAWALVVLSGRAERAARRLELSSARLAVVVESSPGAVIGLGLDGTIESWNARAQHVYGYSALRAVGQPITILAAPEDAGWRERLSAAVGGEVVRWESQGVCVDGSRVAVAVTIAPIRDLAGAVRGLSFLAQDISERKAAEHELSRLAQAADYGTDAILSVDLEGRVLRWNHGAERLYGFDAQEVLGKRLLEFTLLHDEPSENIARALAGESGFSTKLPGGVRTARSSRSVRRSSPGGLRGRWSG